MRYLILAATHVLALGLGFGLGVYFLPIITAPPAPDASALSQSAKRAQYSATLSRDLPGSDAFHWGEGVLHLSAQQLSHQGNLSPGPDYFAYLVPEFVADEASFEALKDKSLQLGPIKSFDGFILDFTAPADLDAYTTVVIWCERFGEFITAGQYR